MSRDALIILLVVLAFFYSLQTIQSFILHLCVSVLADVLIPHKDRETIRMIIQPYVLRARTIVLRSLRSHT